MRANRGFSLFCVALFALIAGACGKETPPQASSIATNNLPATSGSSFQTQVNNGCVISAANPPYANQGDAVFVDVTGTCTHMHAPDTGELSIEIDGTPHGESEQVPHFDDNGNFTARPFISQDGKVCGHRATITIAGKYDFTKNLSDTGSTSFTLTCAGASPTAAAATAAPQAAAPHAAAPAPTHAPVVHTPAPTPKPYQTQVNNGCVISAAKPPYQSDSDAVFVPVSGHCTHMRSPDTGQYDIKVNGAEHGETEEVPHFDSSGGFSGKPFIKQDGHVCGQQVTITISGKYDFNNNLSDVGSTTFTLVCA